MIPIWIGVWEDALDHNRWLSWRSSLGFFGLGYQCIDWRAHLLVSGLRPLLLLQVRRLFCYLFSGLCPLMKY